MKQFAFLKLIKMAAIAVISAFFLLGCAEDPATGVNNDGGGGYSNGSGDGSSSGGGGGGGTAVSQITLKNSTGYYIHSWWIKPSTSTYWGSENWVWLSDGQSQALSLSESLFANTAYDIRLAQNQFGNSGHNFVKYGFTVSNGMTITFTTSDLSDKENPSITIQNRSGVNFNAICLRPSSVPESSSDWGGDYGSLNNNSDKSIAIPIPPSNYTIFDIQMRSSNPTNTYTKKNVTVTDGMVVMYTSADRDNPTIELPVIVIKNNTGYYINSWWISPSASTDWGSENWVFLSDGQSKTASLPQSLSANSEYDIRLAQNQFGNSGYNFVKYNVTASEGMILTFTTSDLAE
jgi:hypothetical protein